MRPEVNREAEPQVVGLAPQTTELTERANTMKTYILRDPKTVEPQKAPPAIVGRGMFGRGMERAFVPSDQSGKGARPPRAQFSAPSRKTPGAPEGHE